MAHADFEEREFETALYSQLRASHNLVWSPGQVLEGHIGFDYAAVCVDSYFWGLHGISQPLEGFLLEEMFLRRMWRHRSHSRPMPDFSLNLFLQAKRHESMLYVSKPLKSSGLKAPYWRAKITPHQQTLLEELSTGANGKALVCYATPAFHKVTQLYAHTRAGTIVENTSFPEVLKLSGHSAWHYSEPGVGGIANPEPTFVETPSLRMLLDNRRQSAKRGDDSRFDQNLKALEASILRTMGKAAGDASRNVVFGQKVADIDYWLQRRDLGQYSGAIRAYLVVLAFCETFGQIWLVAA